MSPLGFWFYVTGGEVKMLYVPWVPGGGLIGILGVPFTIGTIVALASDDPWRAGTRALIGALVAGGALTAIIAAMFAPFSSEAQARARVPGQAPVTP